MGNLFKTSVHLLHYYIKEIVIPRLPFFIFETCGLIKIRSKGSISYLTKLNKLEKYINSKFDKLVIKM